MKGIFGLKSLQETLRFFLTFFSPASSFSFLFITSDYLFFAFVLSSPKIVTTTFSTSKTFFVIFVRDDETYLSIFISFLSSSFSSFSFRASGDLSAREEEDPPISPAIFGGFVLNTFWKETFFTLGLICPSFPLFS